LDKTAIYIIYTVYVIILILVGYWYIMFIAPACYVYIYL